MSERTIKTTESGWSAIFTYDKKGGPLTLTNRSLTLGASGKILLEEVKSVDIETRVGNMPRIKIIIRGVQVRRTEYIEFENRGVGHSLLIYGGVPEFAHSEVSAYTAYWASLITMAVFASKPEEKTKPTKGRKTLITSSWEKVDKNLPIGWGLKKEVKAE